MEDLWSKVWENLVGFRECEVKAGEYLKNDIYQYLLYPFLKRIKLVKESLDNSIMTEKEVDQVLIRIAKDISSLKRANIFDKTFGSVLLLFALKA